MYSLGEEHRLITYDDKQPEANRKFRRHLQGKYPSLDALNQVWDTKFKSWDDVTMMPKELIDVLKLEDGGPPRFESRRFLEHLFADKHAFLADYWRRLDSRAEVGIHVGWDLWMGRGYDYWLLSRSLDGMCGYPGPQNQYIRSFFQKPLGCWYHYCAGSVEDVRWTPWQMLISGMRGFGWYTLGPQRWWAATTADMRLASDFAASKDEFRDAGDLGDVLSQARFQDNQVAVHYSQDSMHTLGFGPGNLSWVHWSFINLFYDHGVPFKFVSYEEVAKGELARRRYRVFLMPSSVSLSPEEAKAIRDYAAQGGVVWADRMPGTHDQFGRPAATPALAELFAKGSPNALLAGIGNYSYDRNVDRTDAARAVMEEVVRLGGLEPVADSRRPDGRKATGIWQSGWECGNQRYVALAKDWQQADSSVEPVSITFPRPAHVYEMRQGEYLGHTNKINAELAPCLGRVYALLPYQARGLDARLAAPPERGKDLIIDLAVEADGEIGPGDIHLIRIAAEAPDGKELRSLRKFAVIRGGRGQIRLPLAYDDPAGSCAVKLKDQSTGKETQVKYQLPEEP